MGKVNGDHSIINWDFVPTNPFYIDYDGTKFSYIPFSGSDKINEIKKDAEEKINKIIKIKFEMAQSSSMFLSSSRANSDKSNQKFDSLKKIWN